MRSITFLGAALAAALVLAQPRPAQAFCGFYVADSDQKLYANATMVVMMREGTKTVLSMQNNYQGPPENFAMVIPVPVVLLEEHVKTLPREVFDKVDKLASPRLVEYWEQDPCNPEPEWDDDEMVAMAPTADSVEEEGDSGGDEDYKVTIEAQFTVGEYEIVILSAEDSTGLDRWLRKEKYSIPEGAEPLLRPYVAQGMKFFVAKVDTKKVAFKDGQAVLSPLRFHYDSHQFNLPIRLGLVNSQGSQDLLVHILSPGQRYEVANYNNVTIPTNLEVSDDTRTAFANFYDAVFSETIAKYEGSVVTEYSWDSASCDPCPTPPLEANDLATLGADVTTEKYGFVLTRLHARYSAATLGDDLVFRAAPPIVGGREFVRSGDGKIERGAKVDQVNNFQARYIIRHQWTGPIDCPSPKRGVWGGPPGGGTQMVTPAEDMAFIAKQPVSLDGYLQQDVEEIDYKMSKGDPKLRFKQSGIQRKGSGCAGCASQGDREGLFGFLLLFGVAVFVVRRTWRTPR